MLLTFDFEGEVIAGLCAFAWSARCIEDELDGNPGLCSTSWLVPIAADAPMGDVPLATAVKASPADEPCPLADNTPVGDVPLAIAHDAPMGDAPLPTAAGAVVGAGLGQIRSEG